MDIETSLGMAAGVGVISQVILMGGELGMFANEHAAILIFGGSTAATLIRFPLNAIVHGVPMGARFAFTMRRTSQRELVVVFAGFVVFLRLVGLFVLVL